MKREKPIGDQTGPCLNCCAVRRGVLPLNTRLIIGFGFINVECDGVEVWSVPTPEIEPGPTLRKFENMARKNPKADWRVHFHGPMDDRHYQRQGRNRWVLYEKGLGFA